MIIEKIIEKVINKPLKVHAVKGNKSFLNKVLFCPEEKYYEEIGEEPYIKYICPICNYIFKQQVNIGSKNCNCCGVNLYWEEKEKDIDKK